MELNINVAVENISFGGRATRIILDGRTYAIMFTIETAKKLTEITGKQQFTCVTCNFFGGTMLIDDPTSGYIFTFSSLYPGYELTSYRKRSS